MSKKRPDKVSDIKVTYIYLDPNDPYFRLKREWESRRMRVNLLVPYRDKEVAKRYGARWDAVNKTWFTENVDNLSKLKRWL